MNLFSFEVVRETCGSAGRARTDKPFDRASLATTEHRTGRNRGDCIPSHPHLGGGSASSSYTSSSITPRRGANSTRFTPRSNALMLRASPARRKQHAPIRRPLGQADPLVRKPILRMRVPSGCPPSRKQAGLGRLFPYREHRRSRQPKATREDPGQQLPRVASLARRPPARVELLPPPGWPRPLAAPPTPTALLLRAEAQHSRAVQHDVALASRPTPQLTRCTGRCQQQPQSIPTSSSGAHARRL